MKDSEIIWNLFNNIRNLVIRNCIIFNTIQISNKFNMFQIFSEYYEKWYETWYYNVAMTFVNKRLTYIIINLSWSCKKINTLIV